MGILERWQKIWESEHYKDPILIQISFQENVAAYTHWIVLSWCFESPEDEHMLSEIYARVREAGKSTFLEYWEWTNPMTLVFEGEI